MPELPPNPDLDMPGSEMAKEGGDEGVTVSVDLKPAAAWVWRQDWLQKIWRKVRPN